jgi:hypothetical protein
VPGLAEPGSRAARDGVGRAQSRRARPGQVLAVTSTQDELSAAGIAAIQAGAASGNYTVTAPAPAALGAELTPAALEQYRAVVFLNTGIASPLTDAQRANFEAYFRDGGGFVGVGSAVDTDPSWTFLTNILGTRASSSAEVQSGTVKVFDRVHDASKSLPEYWDRTDNWYNFSTNVRGVAHVLNTVIEDPFSVQPQGNTLDGIAGGTMGANHPISWCKDYQGGRSFYTGLGNTVASFDASLSTHLKGPFNDQLTDEQQIVRITNATGGTFTLTFKGQTTAPLPLDATAAQIDAALEALSNIGANNVQATGGPVNTTNVNVFFRRALQQANQDPMTGDGTALAGATAPTLAITTQLDGGRYQNPAGESRRGALNSNDLRGKVLRVKVKDSDITAADANKADFGSGTGAYTIPSGNLFPVVAGAPRAKTRPEIYAMGFRNPFRIQVDENDVAYVSDYSPDSQVQQRSRGPAGTGRYEIVRTPANYDWPTCYSSKLGYYKWNFHEYAPTVPVTPAPPNNQAGMPLNDPPQPIDCGGPSQRNDSRWVRDGGPANEPGLQDLPPVTDPDIWYSYRDNNAATPLGTPCFGYYATTPGTIAPGSTTECPRLFPELFTGGVGPHGIAKYHYDAANPNPKKFPPCYDNSVIIGEFTQDTMRVVKLDSQNRVFKVNGFLDCGQANIPNPVFSFECDNPMDMQWGADGSFYLMTYGDGFFTINQDAGLYRWDYVKGKRAPKAVLQTDRTDGPLPLTVQFTGSNSSDDDPGDSIRFEWDFGDGSPISTEPNPSHTYTKAGRYQAVLKVFDSSGQQTASSVPITAVTRARPWSSPRRSTAGCSRSATTSNTRSRSPTPKTGPSTAPRSR